MQEIKEKEKEKEEDPAERRKRIIEGWKKNAHTKEKHKKTILAIDDMSENLHALKALLEDAYDVRVARSGELAQSILNNIFVDLILLDIEMPEESGFDYLQRLKTNIVTKHIPVIFLSSHAEPEVVEYASKLEIEGYFRKPVNPEMLRQKIHEIFQKR
jgi:putative two-component system response regulator